MTQSSCSLPSIAGLAVMALIPLVTAMPAVAQASPSTVASMRTVAIASDPGVAEALAEPAGGSATTRVTVEVTTEADQAPPVVAAPAAAPTPAATPVVEPASPPPPHVAAPAPRPEDRYREQARDDRKSGRGLLAAGLTVAGAAYVLSSLAGAIAIDRSRDLGDDPLTEVDEGRRGERRRAFGRALLIPGVGPALAIARADTATRAWAAGVAGLTQAVGAGLAVVGIQRLVRARRLERLSLSATGSSRGAHVSLQVRF